MRRLLFAVVLAFSGLAFLAGERALAQGYYGPRNVGPAQYPTVSPYINLLRGGNPPWLNYAGLVRPQVDFQRGIFGLQQQVTANQQGLTGLETAAGLISTGHPTNFLNTSHYFLSRGGLAGTGTARQPVPGRATAPGTQQGTQGSRGGRGAPVPK